MADNSRLYIGQVVKAVDGHWWEVTEIRPDGPYGYRVADPGTHPHNHRHAGYGSGVSHAGAHARHHHGYHHKRRMGAAPPHHANHNAAASPSQSAPEPRSPAPGGQAGAAAGASMGLTAGIPGHKEGVESRDLSETVEQFEKRHARPIMAIQGVVDIAAGSAGLITSIALISALAAPETLGASLVIGIAVLAVYDVFRGTAQVGVGMTEVTTAALGTSKQVTSVGEGMEKVKTLTNVTAYMSMGYNGYKHQAIDWKRAKYFGDAETLAGGIAQGKLAEKAGVVEDVVGLMKISKPVQNARKTGDYADKADQVNTGLHDALDQQSKIKKMIADQQARRNAAAAQRPPVAPARP